MKRRDFLFASAAAVSLPLMGCKMGNHNTGTVNANTGALKPLRMPQLLTGTQFDLNLQNGSREFIAGLSTPTFGINADFLGPVIKVRNGDTVNFNVRNNLAETATLHWHGMHVPGSADGGPHQAIASGGLWQPSFTVKQKACTNWYHSHTHNKTGEQVYRGLAGMMIVEDTESDALDLPKTWAEDDFPLIIQDRKFNANGSFNYLPSRRDAMHGMLGDTFMINGTVNPYLDLPNKEVRFRILNASNARVYRLKLSNGASFKQIATDNAFRETPLNLTSITLSPAERAEIVVDLSQLQGQTLTLQDANNGNTPLLTLNVNKTAGNITAVPAQLTALTSLDPATAVRTRPFVLERIGGMNGSFAINGKAMSMARIDHSMNLDEVEIWEIRNAMGMTHNFHTHATHFQIIERNGSANNVAEYEKGYKDTVRLSPNERVKVVIKMTDYTTDASAPYMFHCHILEHEDRGMMGQFTVV
ncbi:MAG: multicopper oxidase domain-containing protein [Gammaproteobacteria bacterium]|nr:multicopper oxidase domain-containing protein [Gammaproteobacteria bacterium]